MSSASSILNFGAVSVLWEVTSDGAPWEFPGPESYWKLDSCCNEGPTKPSPRLWAEAHGRVTKVRQLV